ncbi:MAG: DsbA family protein, partial [Bryobacteraceae bacterium]
LSGSNQPPNRTSREQEPAIQGPCEKCGLTAPVVRQLLAAYPTQVRFGFKHFPLPMHKESPLAHEAALAAGDQGKFWEMHDLLFATQAKWVLARSSANGAESEPVPNLRDDLIAKAQQLTLDVPRFTKDLDTHRFKPQVEKDRQEGNRLGVDGTPFFFINGHAISGGVNLQSFKHLIDATLKETAAPPARPEYPR